MDENILNNIPIASIKSNKSENGILACISGSKLIPGSAIFNLLAASNVGVGYIYAIVSNDIYPIVSSQVPWALYSLKYEPKKETTVLIGSGCDNREDFDEILINILNSDKNVILDAFGLKEYTRLKLTNKSKLVMTPHLKEFSIMCGYSIKDIKNSKLELANNYAKRNNCVLVLKDYETLICDGEKYYLNHTGNQALAKAGSGDILAGFISGLIARKVEPFLACQIGTRLLGLAAENATNKQAICAITPLDILEESKNILFSINK